MIRFEEIKPKILCMDDQMEIIVRMKQGENTTNEDFLKQALKEIKVYEKHGGSFLWGSSQEKLLAEELEKAKVEYASEQGTQMTQEMEKAVLKKARRSINHVGAGGSGGGGGGGNGGEGTMGERCLSKPLRPLLALKIWKIAQHLRL